MEKGEGAWEIALVLPDSLRPQSLLVFATALLSFNMRFDSVLPPLFALLATVSGQSSSGLSFDSRGEVSLIWAFDSETSGQYDFYLCAGDESTESYVSDMMHRPSLDVTDNDAAEGISRTSRQWRCVRTRRLGHVSGRSERRRK